MNKLTELLLKRQSELEKALQAIKLLLQIHIESEDTDNGISNTKEIGSDTKIVSLEEQLDLERVENIKKSMKRLKVCVTCNEPFAPKSNRQMRCSEKCGMKPKRYVKKKIKDETIITGVITDIKTITDDFLENGIRVINKITPDQIKKSHAERF